nr:hypothetical protein [Tanacetum cinerariifolium]
AVKVQVQGEPPAVDQKASKPPVVDNRPPATVTPLDIELPVGITQPFPYWTPQKNQEINVQGEPPAVDQKASKPPVVDNRPPATVTPLDIELPVGITQPFPY